MNKLERATAWHADCVATLQAELAATAERERVLVNLLHRTINATRHVVRHDNLRRDIHKALNTLAATEPKE